MWPNAVGTFKRPLAGVHKVCLGYSQTHKRVKKNILKNLKTLKKNKS